MRKIANAILFIFFVKEILSWNRQEEQIYYSSLLSLNALSSSAKHEGRQIFEFWDPDFSDSEELLEDKKKLQKKEFPEYFAYKNILIGKVLFADKMISEKELSDRRKKLLNLVILRANMQIFEKNAELYIEEDQRSVYAIFWIFGSAVLLLAGCFFISPFSVKEDFE